MHASSLIQLLESRDESSTEEAKALIQENLNCTREPALIHSLIDYYIEHESRKALQIIICVREPHDKHLFDKCNEILKRNCYEACALHTSSSSSSLSSTNFNSSSVGPISNSTNNLDIGTIHSRCLNLVWHVIRKQPSWLHRITNHELFKTLIKILKNENDIQELMLTVLIMTSLLPIIPTGVFQYLGEIFLTFTRLATWSLTKPANAPDVHALHLQVAVNALFRRLYGMFPCNFLSFLRSHYGGKGDSKAFQYCIQPLLGTVTLHPKLIFGSKESETKHGSWKQQEPHDIAMQCLRVSVQERSTDNAGQQQQRQQQQFANSCATSPTYSSFARYGSAINTAAHFDEAHQSVFQDVSETVASTPNTPNRGKTFKLTHHNFHNINNNNLPNEQQNDSAVASVCGNDALLLGSDSLSAANGAAEYFMMNERNGGASGGVSCSHSPISYRKQQAGSMRHSASARQLEKENADSRALVRSGSANGREMFYRGNNGDVEQNTIYSRNKHESGISTSVFSERQTHITGASNNTAPIASTCSTPQTNCSANSVTRRRMSWPISFDRNRCAVPKMFRPRAKSLSICFNCILLHTSDVADIGKLRDNCIAAAAARNEKPFTMFADVRPLGERNAMVISPYVYEWDAPFKGAANAPNDHESSAACGAKIVDVLSSNSAAVSRPLELLERHMGLSSDFYYRSNDLPLPIGSAHWTHFGGSAPNDEISLLRTQLRLGHHQLMFEKHEKQLQIERNKRLFGKMKSLIALEEQNHALKQQIMLHQQETEYHKSIVKKCKQSGRAALEQADKLKLGFEKSIKRLEEANADEMEKCATLHRSLLSEIEKTKRFGMQVQKLEQKCFNLQQEKIAWERQKPRVEKMQIELRTAINELYEVREINEALRKRANSLKPAAGGIAAYKNIFKDSLLVEISRLKSNEQDLKDLVKRLKNRVEYFERQVLGKDEALKEHMRQLKAYREKEEKLENKLMVKESEQRRNAMEKAKMCT